MLFITNRYPTNEFETVINRKFDIDLENNAASNSVFYCERNDEEDYTEIGSANLLERLKKSDYKQILLYIHGFSNLPEDVFSAVDEMQKLFNKKKRKQILILPIIWPCDNDLGIIKDYWDDQKAADQSALSFSRVLERFMDWRDSEDENLKDNNPCLKRINMLAHSMGNRVLRQTLLTWNYYDLASGVPQLFRNTFLIAADIVNESLHEDKNGKHICHASRNVIVYHASDDLALRSSKASNLKNRIASRRLGHSGPENMQLTPKNVYSVDCDDINNDYDFPKGHSYFRSGKTKGEPGLVFEHIYKTLNTGRVFPDDEYRRTIILK